MNPNAAILPMNEITYRTPYASCVVGKVTQVWRISSFIKANKSTAYQNFVLKDNTDSVMVTLYGNLAAEATHILHEGAVIRIQNFSTKPAKGRAGWQISSLYENGRLRTEVTEEEDPDLINSFSFTRFSPLIDCQSYAEHTFADLIVIVSAVDDMETWTPPPPDARPPSRFREITAFDTSGAEAKFTIWGRLAEGFSSPIGTVLAFRNAKIKKFQGKTKLTIAGGSNIHVSPRNDESRMLREWDDLRDRTVPFYNISENATAAPPGNSIIEIKESAAPPAGRVQMRVRAMRFFGENTPEKYSDHFYKGCPKSTCTKAVTEVGGKYFHCKRCKRTYANHSQCIRLWVTFADSTDTFSASLFQRHLEAILPISINSLYHMAIHDKRLYEMVLAQYLVDKDFNATVSVSQEGLRLNWQIQELSQVAPVQNTTQQSLSNSETLEPSPDA